MKERCYDIRHKKFKDYGGRGIKVCDRWRNSFEAFYADMGDRPKGATIGRMDNDGDYEPGNCRWETLAQQSRNKRTTVWVTHEGRPMKLVDLCDKLKLKRGIVYGRLRMGWSLEEALARPYRCVGLRHNAAG